MAGYIFQKVTGSGILDAPSQDIEAARQWMRDQALAITSVNKTKIMRGKTNFIDTIDEKMIGRLVMYYYSPKYKDNPKKLPYYDTFPLGIIIDMKKDGFLSLNLHYLSPYLRATLMDNLYSTLNNTSYDDTSRLLLTYQLLKTTNKFSFFKPCIKRYLWGHIRSPFLNVPPQYWDFALMLPTARFERQSKEYVWQQSADMIFQSKMGFKKAKV